MPATHSCLPQKATPKVSKKATATPQKTTLKKATLKKATPKVSLGVRSAIF